MSRRGSKPETPTIRCAIYTRKSSEEGLELEFNSLDAQREAAEAFIASQKAEGWEALPERYDDGGFSGGNMERPALDRLLRDIERGKVDCVVVYKVDRLSRSLLDFARIMETFDKNGISFVSVTQQFNTTHSMGRLTLNILLSFAQFEREIIGERIRDKLAAQARKGKWTGGAPVLGYDVDRSGPSPRLVVNAEEAAQVREIFRMYAEEAAMLPVVQELTRRGWVNKLRVTKKGKELGGKPFNKSSLHSLLTNPIYVGMMRYKDELHEGEHEEIIERDLFEAVQKQLKRNGRTGGKTVRNRYGALLRGLLRCKSCGASMTHTFTNKGDKKSYRYYRCTIAIKNGHEVCSTGTLPAAEIERVIIDEIRGLARDEDLFSQVLMDVQKGIDRELADVRRNRDDLRRECKRHHAELRDLAASGDASSNVTSRIADLHSQLSSADGRLRDLDAQIVDMESQTVTRAEARKIFGDFDVLWDSLIPREQARLLQLLISAVEYDAEAGTVSVTFRPAGIRTLIDQKLENAA